MPLAAIASKPFIGIWEITEPWQDMLELFQNKAFYAEEVFKIKSDNRKREWLAVRLLIKSLTGSEIPVRYKENGAPFLVDNRYHISISHTQGYAAVILSQYPYPGIDIEYRSDRAWKLRTKYLSTDELEMFEPISPDFQTGNEPLRLVTIFDSTNQTGSIIPPLQSALATLCWCAKETAYKALQLPDIDFIKHLHIEPFSLSEKGIISLKETITSNQTTFKIHYQLTEDFSLTWGESGTTQAAPRQ